MTTYSTASTSTAYEGPRPLLPYNADATDPSRLAPPDALYATASGSARASSVVKDARRKRLDGKRPGFRRKKGTWKKLLWVKQSYPDNYTDEETFLDHLQRNPRLQPYEFWPLVAASTVIVQHVCSVIIFICCFTGIVLERVSPVAVVSTGSLGTVLGWAVWDFWVGNEEVEEQSVTGNDDFSPSGRDAETETIRDVSMHNDGVKDDQGLGIELTAPSPVGTPPSSTEASVTSSTQSSFYGPNAHEIPPWDSEPLAGSLSARNRQRLATAKSALLIYCALLGLSPILKSLTKSTSSDSIWTISCFLLIINVFFFDYGGGVGAKFPASLSTNAALMASTVLASRLTSTTHVFSLLLFSIEVFGLFPVFRRYLRHMSWWAHVALTVALTLGAGAGLSVIVTGGGWQAAVGGAILGGLGMSAAMGTCAMWLIGLQKYKNEIHGPWDPARPVIRRRWD
ncbi:GPI2-domain-containing protein [Rhizodiscina lignyota]|uniref:GPI2-domain-containing protein n=1 Tax=Rhizodiscina lignyota TaxID=1504668 RepID=A0A9P4ISA8_9PEZI|nr:GPI2-domain-containing protein [Rhizodiscina lignyota]